MRNSLRVALCAVALTGAGQAEALNVSLGASGQNFTLYGQGPIAPGIGSFTVGQGSSSFDGTTSTFTLSGAITGGSPGFDSGTYAFVTTYAGADSPEAGPNAPTAQSNPSNTNSFFYTGLDPSTTITLFLDTPGQDYAIPLVTGGSFVPGTGFSFLFTGTTCTGVATCGQNNVGLTPGATIFGPVTISASFPDGPPVVGGVPEPSTWAMFVLAFGLVGVAARRRRTVVAG